ncbi:kinase-like domain-containing protein [Aspergillus crustosus]
MSSPEAAGPGNNTEAPTYEAPPTLVKSLQDLMIVESWTPEGKLKSTSFFHITATDEVFFGRSSKNKRELSIQEFNTALHRVQDEEIYPKVPPDVQLTIAPDDLEDSLIYVKRPGLRWYEDVMGTEYCSKAVLEETLVMEEISRSPHPNIIRYHGSRVRRGYITSIVLEKLDITLDDFVSTPESQHLNRIEFFESLRSAVEHLHSLGLAHNDINPQNIMVKNGAPVLIDFDSCQPFGKRLQSLGTEGWYEKPFFTSEKEHDVYSLGKIQEWLKSR